MLHALQAACGDDDAARSKMAHPLFMEAINALVQWQSAFKTHAITTNLAANPPAYDEVRLRGELQLFLDFYVVQYRNMALSTAQQKIVASAFDLIVAKNLDQAQAFVQGNFVPRNLMFDAATAKLDLTIFSEATIYYCGPISYDIAALFKDAAIAWREEQILDWTIRYWEHARKAKLPVPADFSAFYADCEWMALQRHLTVLGKLARAQDGAATLENATENSKAMQHFMAYVRHTCDRYRALGPLLAVIDFIESTAPADVAYSF